MRPGLRLLAARDAGAGRVARRRASSRIAAIRGYSVIGMLANGSGGGAGADRSRRRHAAAGTGVSGDAIATVRGEVLPFWQSPRGPQRMLAHVARDPAGDHAAAPARGLRQHREPGARARQRAAARDGRAPRARRGTVARRQPAAHRERAAGAGRRGARRARLPSGARSVLSALPPFRVRGIPVRSRPTSIASTWRSRCCSVSAAASLFGLAPALQLARVDAQQALRTGREHAPAAAACATR